MPSNPSMSAAIVGAAESDKIGYIEAGTTNVLLGIEALSRGAAHLVAVSATGVRWPLASALLLAGSTRGISNVATATESIITAHNGAVLVSEGGGAA